MASAAAPTLNWRVTRRQAPRRAVKDVKRSATVGGERKISEVGEGHVPRSHWDAVSYTTEGSETDVAVLKAYAFVKEHFEIPTTIEGEAFGPLSGCTFEGRVVDAHLSRKLKAKPGHREFANITVCTTCGDAGHARRECPKAY